MKEINTQLKERTLSLINANSGTLTAILLTKVIYHKETRNSQKLAGYSGALDDTRLLYSTYLRFDNGEEHNVADNLTEDDGMDTLSQVNVILLEEFDLTTDEEQSLDDILVLNINDD